MQSAEERRRLMSKLGSESITPLGAILKCAAGILVLAIIAAGPWAFLISGGPTASNEAHPASKVGAAQAEGKRVFDERRRAYEDVRDSGVAKASEATRTTLAVE